MLSLRSLALLAIEDRNWENRESNEYKYLELINTVNIMNNMFNHQNEMRNWLRVKEMYYRLNFNYIVKNCLDKNGMGNGRTSVILKTIFEKIPGRARYMIGKIDNCRFCQENEENFLCDIHSNWADWQRSYLGSLSEQPTERLG